MPATTPKHRPLALRNVTLVTALSQETDCFQAKIYVGETRVGTCENRGTGGQTEVWIDAKVQPPTREELRLGALDVIERLATPDDRALLDRYPDLLTVTAVDLLLSEWIGAREAKRRAERIRRKEIANAREFLRRGLPVMLRIEMEKEIVWYGLRDDKPQTIAGAQRACAAKYGVARFVQAMKVQAVLDRAAAVRS